MTSQNLFCHDNLTVYFIGLSYVQLIAAFGAINLLGPEFYI
jgi:hypothetical protein